MMNFWREKSMKEDILEFYKLYDPLNLQEIRRASACSSIIEDINNIYNLSTPSKLKATVVPNIAIGDEVGEDIASEEEGETCEEEESTSCLKVLRKKRCWNPLVKVFKFVVHFAVVMLVLFLGAVVFARIEDRIGYDHDNTAWHLISSYAKQQENGAQVELENGKLPKSYSYKSDNFCNGNATVFWWFVKNKFNISLNEKDKLVFLESTAYFLDAVAEREEMLNEEIKIRDRQFVFTKWFYFMTIATTTIGDWFVYLFIHLV